MNRFYKTCLALIVLLLAAIVVRQQWEVPSVRASTTYSYDMYIGESMTGSILTGQKDLKKVLNDDLAGIKREEQGYQVVAMQQVINESDCGGTCYFVYFLQKPK